MSKVQGYEYIYRQTSTLNSNRNMINSTSQLLSVNNNSYKIIQGQFAKNSKLYSKYTYTIYDYHLYPKQVDRIRLSNLIMWNLNQQRNGNDLKYLDSCSLKNVSSQKKIYYQQKRENKLHRDYVPQQILSQSDTYTQFFYMLNEFQSKSNQLKGQTIYYVRGQQSLSIPDQYMIQQLEDIFTTQLLRTINIVTLSNIGGYSKIIVMRRS